MLKLLPLLGLSFLPFVYAAGSAATTHTVAQDTALLTKSGVQCEVRATKVPQGVRLEAVVAADRKLAGEYQFKVAKRGTAGTSQTAQSGEFSIRKGGEKILGEVGLGTGDRAAVDAKLTVWWKGGELSCSRSYPRRV